ncbi:hydrogenase subunit [Mariprofundus sp. EBB-1]|uniref:hydrogenase large subunit n=1 Tax=Mariprofundus sp. EBB-1 TaxID=2650971 RepID=UPI000EF283BE|nr:NADH-quinone oxidoreductase subunit C [Mariprofundus sp. EBB-1]RLL51159.1 hydrogenase subunit [Mariprofundus sp. EBB-1]
MKHLVNTWFAEQLSEHGMYTNYLADHHPKQMPCLEIRFIDWEKAAETARRLEMRLVAVWATEGGFHEQDEGTYVYMSFAHPEHRHALVRTLLGKTRREIPSISKHYIAASRMERHIQDMFGIEVTNTPDERRWIKHEHWPEYAYPLLRSFDRNTRMERAEGEYPFVQSDSEGVYEIPVGPVHAGIIEPGQFRFLAVGEQILNMEQRLGFVHKGIEKSMQGRTAEQGVRLAARVSGDSTVGHAWAFAQACEYAADIRVSKRTSYLRGVLCERERMVNHIGDIGAICNDAAFSFMHNQCLRLREDMARQHARLFGHRLMMDTITPGGVTIDLSQQESSELIDDTRQLAAEVEHLRTIYADNPSIQERVIGSGSVSISDARDIGLLGYAGRASGDYPDERIEEAYPPYDDLDVNVPQGKLGDVATRVWVRFEEISDSARMIIQLLENLPEGDIQTQWHAPEAGVSGFSAIEAWRGEIACWLRFGENGVIDRYFVRDPSVINWLGLELAVREVPVPDFPLNNKSFNCSYSGNDV